MNFARIDLPGLEKDLIRFRRERHSKPENAWNEYLTTCAIIRELESLDISYQMGKAIHTKGERYGLPEPEGMRSAVERALREGADPALVERMSGGYTGVVGVIDTGRPGPVTALRFDIDCNDVSESTDLAHRPVREGFASLHESLMHACGHDAHTAMGIGVAHILTVCREQLCGKVKLIFQPGEEGGRGGVSMAESGILEDVDSLFNGHVMWNDYGTVAASMTEFCLTNKVDLRFEGVPAHAGASPEAGKNALAAAATAVLNLLAISRHGSGYTRVNVGVCQAGSGRNVIPSHALLQAETRGENVEINDYMLHRMLTVAKAAADMYECGFSHQIMGRAISAPMDQEMIDLTVDVAQGMEEFTVVLPALSSNGGGDDATFLMREVQKRGGKATYLALGASTTAPHHNSLFDIDERVILSAAKLFSQIVFRLNGQNG